MEQRRSEKCSSNSSSRAAKDRKKIKKIKLALLIIYWKRLFASWAVAAAATAALLSNVLSAQYWPNSVTCSIGKEEDEPVLPLAEGRLADCHEGTFEGQSIANSSINQIRNRIHCKKRRSVRLCESAAECAINNSTTSTGEISGGWPCLGKSISRLKYVQRQVDINTGAIEHSWAAEVESQANRQAGSSWISSHLSDEINVFPNRRRARRQQLQQQQQQPLLARKKASGTSHLFKLAEASAVWGKHSKINLLDLATSWNGSKYLAFSFFWF